MSLGLSTLNQQTLQNKQPKDQPLCDDLLTIVENFKKYLDKQKKIKEDVNNISQQPIGKLKEELFILQQQYIENTSTLQRLSVQTSHLKDDLLVEEKNIAIAQKTHETPVGLQCENNAPVEYFSNKINDFENKIKLYKQELEAIEEIISSQSSDVLSPKELAEVIRQMDDQFISVAAQLYTANEEFKGCRSLYLRELRTTCGNGDYRNPFSEVDATFFKDQNSLNGDTNNFSLVDADLFRAPCPLTKQSLSTPYGPSPFDSAGFNIGQVTTPGSGLISSNLMLPKFGQPANDLSFIGFQTSTNSKPDAGTFNIGRIGTPSSVTGTTGFTGFTMNPPTSSSFSFGAASSTSQQTQSDGFFSKRVATKPSILNFNK